MAWLARHPTRKRSISVSQVARGFRRVSLRVLVVCAAQLAPNGAAGQPSGAIAGLVRDTAGAPLPEVQVLLSPTERELRTDASGRFRLTGLPPGRYVVIARRVGFKPATLSVVLGAGQVSTISIVLTRGAVTLDTVSIAGSCPSRSFAGFVCRKNGGRGVFLDVSAIDSANAFNVKQLFWQRPGFRVTPDGVEATSGWRCLTPLVNGEPVSLTNPLPRTPSHLIGVEMYASPNDVPEAYQGYTWRPRGRYGLEYRCSVVVYWTPVRPRR
jgi:hypothetical protein